MDTEMFSILSHDTSATSSHCLIQTLLFFLSLKGGPIQNRKSKRCLELQENNENEFGFQLVLQKCTGQRWSITNVLKSLSSQQTQFFTHFFCYCVANIALLPAVLYSSCLPCPVPSPLFFVPLGLFCACVEINWVCGLKIRRFYFTTMFSWHLQRR